MPEQRTCPTCGPTMTEQHPRQPDVTRCANCKEWLSRPMSTETTEQAAVLAARIARAEALIDAWEHDAPGLVEPVFVGRLREVLRRDPAPVRLRSASSPAEPIPSGEGAER